MEDRESKVQSLDEYLGEIGLSFPVSDFMLDKTRIPHGLTSRVKKGCIEKQILREMIIQKGA